MNKNCISCIHSKFDSDIKQFVCPLNDMTVNNRMICEEYSPCRVLIAAKRVKEFRDAGTVTKDDVLKACQSVTTMMNF